MDITNAKDILQKLADGVNPLTGEMFPDNSLYQNPEIIRAFYTILRLIDDKYKEDVKRNSRCNAGNPWSNDEENQLSKEFDSGMKVNEISKIHKRTNRAIEARLVKIGKITERKFARI